MRSGNSFLISGVKIQKLRLYAKELSALFDFYHRRLGFQEVYLQPEQLQIKSGDTALSFDFHPQGFVYHFAFLIPQGHIPEAIQYLTERKIDLLLYKGKEVIDFGTGKAIYFHDPAGNIVEFIDRPDLGFRPSQAFSPNQVLRLNEIGMPVDNPLEVSEELRNTYKVQLVQPEILQENFCWIGDYEGVFIVVKEGRHWLPTSVPSVYNDFEVEFVEADQRYTFRFEGGEIVDLN